MLNNAILLVAAAAACPVPLEPMALSITPLTGEALGGDVKASVAGQYTVGEFTYEGYGIVERSTDPRFRDLRLDQRLALRHRCGNSVSGPSGWNSRDRNLDSRHLQIEATIEKQHTSPLPDNKIPGLYPILRGYNAGAVWPIFVKDVAFSLGLMHPKNGDKNTVIAAFRNDISPAPALVIAKIPLRLDGFSSYSRLSWDGSFR